MAADDRGDRCVGSTLGRGRPVAVPMASVGNSIVNGAAGGLPGAGGGEVFRQESGLPAPADRQTDALPRTEGALRTVAGRWLMTRRTRKGRG